MIDIHCDASDEQKAVGEFQMRTASCEGCRACRVDDGLMMHSPVIRVNSGFFVEASQQETQNMPVPACMVPACLVPSRYCIGTKQAGTCPYLPAWDCPRVKAVGEANPLSSLDRACPVTSL